MTEAEFNILRKVLRKHSPFDDLDDVFLQTVAAGIKIKTAEPGFCLFKQGDEDDQEYYLINGEIALTATDGQHSTISSKTGRHRFPIARLRPRMFTASANNTIHYFTVHSEVLKKLQSSLSNKEDEALVEVIHQQASQESLSILHEFLQELQAGRFQLPDLPEPVLNIRKMIDSSDCSSTDIAAQIDADPAIAEYFLRIANSSTYRNGDCYSNTNSAVAGLGLIITGQLVTSFAVLTLFKQQSSIFRDQIDKLWAHSLNIAIYCYVIAKHLPRFSEEEAMLGGIVHVVGEIILLSYADRFYDLSNDEEHLNLLTTTLRGRLGARVLKNWNFPSELVTVARESHHWMRGKHKIDELDTDFDYCDLVQIAMLYALRGEDNSRLPNMESVPAFQRLKNRRLNGEDISRILSQAENQIGELRAVFGG